MLMKTQAVVLHSLKYGDSRMIVDMFTRERGRLSFIVTLSKTPKGRFRKTLFQPLMLLEVEADVRPQVQLQKLRDVRLLSPYVSIPFDALKLPIALFVAEFLYHALRGEEQNPQLFDYMVSSFQWLDGRSGQFASFHLVFLMRLLRFLGFYPNLEDYREGDYFDLRASVFCAEAPLHRDFLLPQEAAKLQLMLRMDFPTMHLYRLSHGDRNRLLDLILTYYRLHLPSFPELRSLPVLQELFV